MTPTSQTHVVRPGPDGEVLGYVCVDSTINGRARGGLRLMPDVTQDELEKLARAMTLKYGFLGLPQGGAKGGVLGDPEASAGERASVLLRFARAAAPLLMPRTYVPDADMGMTGSDVQRMLESIGVRISRREYRGSRSGDYTAGTVFEAARAAAGIQAVAIEGCRIAIEGFGKVGGPLAEMFVRTGARVVAISTTAGGLYNPRGLDIATLRERGRRMGGAVVMEPGLGDRIDTTELKRVPADIFCPCARHDSVHEDDVPTMPARVISCGANSPVTPAAEQRLWERGVLCVPDFVANSGGVLGGTMEFAGWRPGEILDFCGRRFGARVASLICDAQRSGQSLRAAAETLALARFDEVKRQAERTSWGRHGVQAALAIYREGWLPGRLVHWLSDGYFRRRVS
jgi:glutamate dehydrogenase/leucine dehydrogenase